jgi:hypothetical protein
MEASHIRVAPNQDEVIPNQVVAGGGDIQGERKDNEQGDCQLIEGLFPFLGRGGHCGSKLFR